MRGREESRRCKREKREDERREEEMKEKRKRQNQTRFIKQAIRNI